MHLPAEANRAHRRPQVFGKTFDSADSGNPPALRILFRKAGLWPGDYERSRALADNRTTVVEQYGLHTGSADIDS